jgi:GNAT superfamily N-acetyltransferase
MNDAAQLQIVPATPGDARQLCALIGEFADFQGCAESLTATPDRLRDVLSGKSPAGHAWLLSHRDTIVGYCFFFFTMSSFSLRPVLHVEDIYLREHVRGQGFGNQVFAALRQHAMSHGCERMQWCAQRNRPQALRFYQKLGAHQIDVAVYDWTTR